ncbi:MAG TPA: Tad domain-containing protein [Blastocatellia bacterium]|nr:Tad domain-containing protein [Blastocatellia bacterium]
MPRTSSITIRRRTERGSVVLLATVAILILVGIMVLAVDLGYVLSMRNQVQNGVDAGALAAAAGLRAAIEPAGSTFERDKLVRELAIDFAGRNYIRAADQITNLTLNTNDIAFDNANPLRILVRSRYNAPTIFANVFGLPTMNISAGAASTVVAVDGGTGMISGCWRPILLPDTFFDSAGRVWAVGGAPFPNYAQAVRSGSELPTQFGDYYCSRFAAATGPRSGYPFIDSINGAGTAVTSIRDTSVAENLKVNGGNNLLAQPINFRPSDYRVVDFNGIGNIGALYTQTFDGFCANIQVGQQVRVFSPVDSAAYAQISYGLADLWYNSMANPTDQISNNEFQTYRYVKSTRYPSPNTHPRIIPVLLFNPLELVRNPNAEYLTITNIGALYLDLAVAGNTNIYGYFFREISIGGLPVQPANAVPAANNNLLPVAVQLSQ